MSPVSSLARGPQQLALIFISLAISTPKIHADPGPYTTRAEPF
jgi:hypothetical protein